MELKEKRDLVMFRHDTESLAHGVLSQRWWTSESITRPVYLSNVWSALRVYHSAAELWFDIDDVLGHLGFFTTEKQFVFTMLDRRHFDICDIQPVRICSADRKVTLSITALINLPALWALLDEIQYFPEGEIYAKREYRHRLRWMDPPQAEIARDFSDWVGQVLLDYPAGYGIQLGDR